MQFLMIVPSKKDIDELLNRCVENEKTGISEYPGMTYEQGIKAGIKYLLGGEKPFN